MLLAQQTWDPRRLACVGACCRNMPLCVQAVKQTISSLTSRLASMAEQVTNLQQQQAAASHESRDSADDSLFKERLRKIELTVAGKSCGLLLLLLLLGVMRSKLVLIYTVMQSPRLKHVA